MSGGKANKIITATTRMYQEYSGIRLIRMPGGRVLSTPTISSTAAAMDAISMNDKPSSQISTPWPSRNALERGGYMNQPPFGATPKKMEPQTKMPPIKNDQKP